MVLRSAFGRPEKLRDKRGKRDKGGLSMLVIVIKGLPNYAVDV